MFFSKSTRVSLKIFVYVLVSPIRKTSEEKKQTDQNETSLMKIVLPISYFGSKSVYQDLPVLSSHYGFCLAYVLHMLCSIFILLCLFKIQAKICAKRYFYMHRNQKKIVFKTNKYAIKKKKRCKSGKNHTCNINEIVFYSKNL